MFGAEEVIGIFYDRIEEHVCRTVFISDSG